MFGVRTPDSPVFDNPIFVLRYCLVILIAIHYTLSMANNILDAVSAIKAEISRLEGVLGTLQNGQMEVAPVSRMTTPPAFKPAKAKPGKKRGRRPSLEVKEQAESMVDFIRSKGSTGATTAQIVDKFGKVLPSIKAFILSKVDVKLKKTGAGRATVYFVD
jgi:hypothetical protein